MNASILGKLTPLGVAVVLMCAGVVRDSCAGEDTNRAASSFMYEGPVELTGTIYAKDSNPRKLLYRFKRQAARSGAKVNVVRDYMNPDGTPAARERIFYDGDKLVSFELEELQIGAGGSARLRYEPGNPQKGTTTFEYNKDSRDAKAAKTSDESLRVDTLVGDMIAPFLAKHWNELSRGDKVKCRYVVVPRRETVGFTFSRDSETANEGHPSLVIRMEATSPFIAALVDPLYFTVGKESPHRVMQYVGRVTPKIKKGDNWEDLDALVVFDWKNYEP